VGSQRLLPLSRVFAKKLLTSQKDQTLIGEMGWIGGVRGLERKSGEFMDSFSGENTARRKLLQHRSAGGKRRKRNLQRNDWLSSAVAAGPKSRAIRHDS
jgi:hypothetical protein